MSESISTPSSMSMEDYQALVAESLRWENRVGKNAWQEKYAEGIREEMIEMLTQHGNSPFFMMPSQVYEEMGIAVNDSKGIDFGKISDKEVRLLADDTLDELSDNLWFVFDTARRLGTTATEAVNGALRHHLGSETPHVVDFAELQDIVEQRADDICVTNKIGLLLGEDHPHAKTSLRDNPIYLLTRTANRLIRALHDAGPAMPPIVSDLEQRQDAPLAAGDYIVVLTYIAATRLGWNIENVAQYNFQKLMERETWGKQEAANTSQ